MGDHLNWFPFQTDKWKHSAAIQEMTFSEKGLYLEMLIYQWHNDGIPKDPKRIKRIFNLTSRQYKTIFEQVVNQFETDGEHFVNKTLQKIKQVQVEKHEKRVNAGRKGGKSSSNALSNATSNVQPKEKNRIDKNIYNKNKQKEIAPEVLSIFNLYHSTFKKSDSYKLTPQREKLIEAALKRGYSPETLNKAILAMSRDDWIDRPKFNDLKYAIGIIKGADNVEKWGTYVAQGTSKKTGGHKAGVPTEDEMNFEDEDPMKMIYGDDYEK